MSNEAKNVLVQKAKEAKEANHYRGIVNAMRAAAKLGVELNAEEQSLFALAYASIMKTHRETMGFPSILDVPSTASATGRLMDPADVDHLMEICKEVLSLLDVNLLPKATNEESKVFYLKMKGDYHCYIAEIGTGDAKYNAINSALDAYLAAWDHLSDAMTSANPVRLGLALNFSTFYRKMLQNRTKACNLINQALDAVNSKDYMNEEAQNIMQALQARLKLWIREK